PLRFYGALEAGIALLSACTPWLIDGIRTVYLWTGGSPALGPFGSAAVRLLLAALVLGPVTWLMGGTLPAIARAAETDADPARRRVALLYGVNTLGAVLGAGLATFVLLERFGSDDTLHLAALCNLGIAVLAWLVGGRVPEQPTAAEAEREAAAPTWLVCTSAALVGFAFFLMELVWYRVLGPLLGGTIFSFGLILAVALLGIGLGGASYAALLAGRRATLLGFAFTCALEAVCIALPYALGDRIALWTVLTRPFGALGFDGLIASWSAIAIIVVLPASLVAGFQFPLLIALLGSGKTRVGADVGLTYAANTLGAVLGALAGGFGLMSALGAIGCWRAVCLLLGLWGALIALLNVRQHALRAGGVVAALGVTLLLLSADGPTAAWRHSPIGAGRLAARSIDSPNTARGYVRHQRRAIDWQIDGVESAIGIDKDEGVSFLVNGKSDGNARSDAATQVMGGLLGAALLPRVDNALVIGLGTGSTAGWLAKLPEIKRVEVAEIEPAIQVVARRCSLVNEHALDNPKLHVQRGDARELLAVVRDRYDVIFSEPSNLYRAGVASLYTREFYDSVSAHLSGRGVFVQWVQAYDVDVATLRSIYATLGSVFPFIETWHGLDHDLLLVASQHEPVHDATRLRARLSAEPFTRAMRSAWLTDGLEGFVGHFIANWQFAREAAKDAPISTDDLTPVEFGFARNLRGSGTASAEFFANTRTRQQHRPPLIGEKIDWDRIDYESQAFALVSGVQPDATVLSRAYASRLETLSKWVMLDFPSALGIWNYIGSQSGEMQPILIERMMLAELFAYHGEGPAEGWLDMLAKEQPTLGRAMRAIWLARHERHAESADALISALHMYRSDPWPIPSQMQRALGSLQLSAASDPKLITRWIEALSQPFATWINDDVRERTRLTLAFALGPKDARCVELLAHQEPNADWNENLLQFRAECYAEQRDPRTELAQRELAAFRAAAPVPFAKLLKP
ncbi:MAG TPA: fused MFS/spermidine synthase, partial [Polyangiales bacterium]|nr:fused MFS/spermidine synthase [Polyangiales bacterium]